jgi:hypothetical protein
MRNPNPMYSLPKLAMLLLLLCSSIISLGQSQPSKFKVVPLLTKQSFYLNGGVRSGFGGKSRVVYEVDLPQNTVEWYYAVTTYQQKQNNSINVGLLEQISRLLDPTGVASNVVGLIATPTGANDCDVYLMDQANQNIFYRKWDVNKHIPFQFLEAGSRENFRNGAVQVKNPTQGVYFLGFRNPSETAGIGIAFEAVAIVKVE